MKTYWQKKQGIIGNYTTLKSFKEERKDSKVRRIAENFIINNDIKSFVDIGCNTGAMFFRMRDRGWKGKYIGIDNNQKALDMANKLLEAYRGLEFRNHDVSNIDSCADGSTELIYSKDVIEHLNCYTDIMKEMFRISSKYILLSTFIKMNNTGCDRIQKHPDGYYLNSYDKDIFKKFVYDNGFTIKYLYQDNVYGLILLEKINTENFYNKND